MDMPVHLQCTSPKLMGPSLYSRRLAFLKHVVDFAHVLSPVCAFAQLMHHQWAFVIELLLCGTEARSRENAVHVQYNRSVCGCERLQC